MKKDFGWLAVAEKDIRQDLETSKKELKLIKEVLDNSEIDLTLSKAPGNRFKDWVLCMRACKEYSGSRVHMLEERIRQIHQWSSNKRMGKDIPDGLPDEWFMVDIEWRQWLSEQTTFQTKTPGHPSAESSQGRGDDMTVRFWGPLIPLLEIYTE
ncbi:hypothetical protein F4805DRAFT_462536 [Annulohypoxylon moriforme]|nr:hypothetical protein F4805DRAFT_462536 [Annulohypoxylon moriforme]